MNYTLVQTGGSQTGVIWLAMGGLFKSCDKICSMEVIGRKSCGLKKLKFLLFVYLTLKNCTTRLV